MLPERSDRRHAQFAQVLKRPVVELGLACCVVVIAGRHEDDHALSGSGEQHAVGVQQILFPFRLMEVLPLVASEGVIPPTAGAGVDGLTSSACGDFHVWSLVMASVAISTGRI